MRPSSIFTFERLGLASILLSAVQIARLAMAGSMTSAEVTLGVVTVIVSVALVLFASRGRSRVALWLLSALTLVDIFAAGVSLGQGFDASQVVDLVAIALQAAAVAFAWTVASRAWFAQGSAAAV